MRVERGKEGRVGEGREVGTRRHDGVVSCYSTTWTPKLTLRTVPDSISSYRALGDGRDLLGRTGHVVRMVSPQSTLSLVG